MLLIGNVNQIDKIFTMQEVHLVNGETWFARVRRVHQICKPLDAQIFSKE